MHRSSILLSLAMFCLAAAGCGDSGEPASKTNSNTRTRRPERVCEPTSDTPTEAYKRLYAAVKSKNTEQIKAVMSRATQDIAEMMAGRQKQPVEEVYKNGFTATTFSPTLPETRDERVKGCWGALEVRNTKENRWEDLGFVNEDGQWKFAMGEFFNGEYQSPGTGMDQLQKQAANAARGNTAVPSYPTANVNSSTPAPYTGPQVNPLPKKK